jgi:AbrB family looped-hinge helix DNA binding protein
MVARTEARTTLDANGRIVVPSPFRRALGIEEGDEVILRLGEGEILITTPRHALRRARALVSRRVSGTRSLAAELIRERREEEPGG